MQEITGDELLSIREKLLYMIYNFLRGIAGYTSSIKTEYWGPQKIEAIRNSPAREYLRQFLIQNLPGFLPVEKIDVLDIGCGSGYIREILSDLGCRGNYTGVEISRHKDFEEKNNRDFDSKLVISRIEDFETTERFDLILSITALEHIKDDRLVIMKAGKLLKPAGIQIHIVPAFWALFLYLFHGYRQYNPKRLKMVFNGKNCRFFRLGGIFSFFLHLFLITLPVFILKTERPRNSAIYPNLVNICNTLDRFFPFCSSMYAVVLKNRHYS